MPRTLLLAFILLIATPLVSLAWVSANAVRSGERAAKQRLVDLLSVQLENADRQIESVFDAYGASLKKQLLGVDGERLAPADVVQQLRAMRWKLPIVRQGLFIDQEGRLLHPGPEDLSQFESTEILTALPGIIDARPELEVPARRSQSTQTASSDEPTRSRRFAVASRSSNLKETASSGAWQQWYLADGAQVIFWLGRDDGTAIGILMERSRWMADVIANLPDQVIDASTSPAGLPLGRVKLVDESNRLIYQWGNAEGSERTTLSERHVAMPLASWRMVLDIDPKLVPQSSVIPIYASLAAVAIVVLAVGGYAVSAVRRQIAEASRRVSFAGQVSHELRTPLTNIRLYTELAEQDVQRLGEETETASLRKRLTVIDHESRRLQRLVSGVLEMIRPSGRVAPPEYQEVDVEQVLRAIADQFEPSFAATGISIELNCRVGVAEVDPDIVEMVMVNLLGNVEKYVPVARPQGGLCRVSATLQRGSESREQLSILVEDNGPGIGRRNHSRVFRPFVRLDDSINAPSGTGIGLTIARRAARRHGGDLLLKSDCELGGAAFELTLPLSKKAAKCDKQATTTPE